MALLTHKEGGQEQGREAGAREAPLVGSLCSLMESWEISTPAPDQAGEHSLRTEQSARGDRRAHL